MNAQAPDPRGLVAPEQRTGGAPPDGLTIDIVAQAWCTAQQRCRHIGPGRDHPNLAACLGDVRKDVMAYFEELDCPRSIDSTRAHSCQAAIEAADCTHQIEKLGSLGGCSKEQLCEP